MLVAIRIKGMNKMNKKVEETLFRMRLRRKYACALFEENKENAVKMQKLKPFIAYSKINDALLKKLIEKRGLKINKDKPIGNLTGIKKEDFEKANLKPFFRLHPPRGGIDSKLFYPKGVLGEHEDIGKLLERML